MSKCHEIGGRASGRWRRSRARACFPSGVRLRSVIRGWRGLRVEALGYPGNTSSVGVRTSGGSVGRPWSERSPLYSTRMRAGFSLVSRDEQEVTVPAPCTPLPGT